MTYLIDSDWVADFLKGIPGALVLLRHLAPSGLTISIVTYGEILEGIHYGNDAQQHRQDFEQFLRFVDITGLDIPVFERFALVRGELRRIGQMIGDLDILIAATAIENGLTLVTRNVGHFQRVPALNIYSDQAE